MSQNEIKVLLVEDDEDDIYLFRQSIRLDNRICQEIDVVSSIAALISNGIGDCDVLVLDLGLPDSVGLKTILTVSNNFPDIPIVVLTGVSNEEVGEQAIQLGAQDYLPKAELCQNLISRSIRFSIERHSLLAKMKNMAHVDQLTLLYNRAHFLERLEHQISLAERNQEVFGLMLIDLDGFKDVNDTLGHQAGDQVLSQFAARLRSKSRKSDLVARLGGDEFIILLSAIKDEKDSEKSAKIKLSCCDEAFLVFSEDAVHKVEIGMSIGLSMYPKSGSSARQLMENADKAMYEVKCSGKNNYRLFS